ncbi:hypothetical protein R3P38DRAFT_3026840 [Favolaschia claudopus]|uniref:Proteophosphoglycan ppg4 n=1 Tax=Favolaschia claudopus TaxID=2862362 RepID=A0AAW0AFD6_9AGAR
MSCGGREEEVSTSSKRRAEMAFSPPSYAYEFQHHAPPPPPPPSHIPPTSSSHMHHNQHQRPTLVIPRFAASTSALVTSTSSSTSTSSASTSSSAASTAATSASSSSSYAAGYMPSHGHGHGGHQYPRSAGGSPLMQPRYISPSFGALSLSSGSGANPNSTPNSNSSTSTLTPNSSSSTATLTPNRPAVKRPRPVSYAGTSSFGCGAGVVAPAPQQEAEQRQQHHVEDYRNQGPETLTASWQYVHGAGAGAQDLYFYQLASSPVSSVSSSASSSSLSDFEGEYAPSGRLEQQKPDHGHPRSASYGSSAAYSDSEDDDDFDMERGAAADDEMEADDGDDGDDSGTSEDGRSPSPCVPMTATPASHFPRPQKGGEDAREAARRARLRCVPYPLITYPAIPATSTSSTHPPPHTQHHSSLPHHPLPPQPTQFAFGPNTSSPARWGVQSARTSPVRGPNGWSDSPPLATASLQPPSRTPHHQWTPPRASTSGHAVPVHRDVAYASWTPPRVALPHFADIDRWSAAGNAAAAAIPTLPAAHQYQSQQAQTQMATRETKTHYPQPRRAIFANAGPPGVSGYAYAY